jgi:hypothetical protein
LAGVNLLLITTLARYYYFVHLRQGERTVADVHDICSAAMPWVRGTACAAVTCYAAVLQRAMRCQRCFLRQPSPAFDMLFDRGGTADRGGSTTSLVLLLT